MAAHAEVVAYFTDYLLDVLHGGDLEEIEEAVEEVLAFRPPHGIDPVMALVIALAAQINPNVPVEDRLAWVNAWDPALHGLADTSPPAVQAA